MYFDLNFILISVYIGILARFTKVYYLIFFFLLAVLILTILLDFLRIPFDSWRFIVYET